MTAALVWGLQRLQMCDMRRAVAASLPLPVELPLEAAGGKQPPLIVCPWATQLRAVTQHQAARIAALDARLGQRSRHADCPHPPRWRGRHGCAGTLAGSTPMV